MRAKGRWFQIKLHLTAFPGRAVSCSVAENINVWWGRRCGINAIVEPLSECVYSLRLWVGLICDPAVLPAQTTHLLNNSDSQHRSPLRTAGEGPSQGHFLALAHSNTTHIHTQLKCMLSCGANNSPFSVNIACCLSFCTSFFPRRL